MEQSHQMAFPKSPLEIEIFKLATAGVLCCSPTTPLWTNKRLHCHRGRYRRQQSRAARAAATPTIPPPVEDNDTTVEQIFSCVWFSPWLFGLFLFLSLLNIHQLTYVEPCLAKLGAANSAISLIYFILVLLLKIETF